jgi:hypothetical protein
MEPRDWRKRIYSAVFAHRMQLKRKKEIPYPLGGLQAL